MSEYSGLSMDRELARLRQAELLAEAAELRAARAARARQSGPAAQAPWLALSLLALVLVAGAAWLLILG